MDADWESLFDDSLTLSLDWAEHTEIDALAELPARRGVLLFADTHDSPIQLVATANLRNLSRSRLADRTDQSPHRKADLASVTRRIYYACSANDFERHLLYQRLTHAVFGKDWKQWLALGRRSYAAIDRQRRFPYFALTGTVEPSEGVELFGPFANRRAASGFCDNLNFAFELCRNPALLDSDAPQSCPYLQMHTCHGLCCREQGAMYYATLVENALRYAAGDIAGAVEDLRRQMKQAAAELNFETAQLRKKQAERLAALLGPDYAWTERLAELGLVVIVAGGKMAPDGEKKKVNGYHLWRIDRDGIYLLGQFAEHDDDGLQELLNSAKYPKSLSRYPYALSRQEHLATVGWFLYRNNRPGLWYKTAALPDVRTILNALDPTPPAVQE